MKKNTQISFSTIWDIKIFATGHLQTQLLHVLVLSTLDNKMIVTIKQSNQGYPSVDIDILDAPVH